MNRKKSDQAGYDPEPPWLPACVQEERERLLAALATVWPVPREPESRAADVQHALSDLSTILGARGEATDVADYLYYQGAVMLGGVRPPHRDAVLPLAEALVRIRKEVWDRDRSI